MNLQKAISENRTLLFLKMIPDMVAEYWKLSRHVARSNMHNESNKLLTELLMGYHSIEKAFSLPEVRIGFGEKKIQKLLADIHFYIGKFGFNESLLLPLSLVWSYLKFQQDNSYSSPALQAIAREFENLCRIKTIDPALLKKMTGSLTFYKDDVRINEFNFEQFTKSRYSVRNFSLEEVTQECITKALKIASKSPSACNRQSYKVHIYDGKAREQILEIQGGSNGFSNQINKAILITGDLNRYYTSEAHLGYVDGALFAMSLIYAFHAMGIGSISLTMARKRERLNKLYSELQLPKNEIPVILIGIGHYPETFKVAKSHRNPVSSYTTIHN